MSEQLDIASAVARIEQIGDMDDCGLRELLIDRLVTCDAPRLRALLDDDTLALLDDDDAEQAG